MSRRDRDAADFSKFTVEDTEKWRKAVQAPDIKVGRILHSTTPPPAYGNLEPWISACVKWVYSLNPRLVRFALECWHADG